MKKPPDGEPFYVRGEYRQVEFPGRLVFSWTWEDPAENVRDTLVTIDFLDVAGGTEIVLMHECFRRGGVNRTPEAGLQS